MLRRDPRYNCCHFCFNLPTQMTTSFPNHVKRGSQFEQLRKKMKMSFKSLAPKGLGKVTSPRRVLGFSLIHYERDLPRKLTEKQWKPNHLSRCISYLKNGDFPATSSHVSFRWGMLVQIHGYFSI